MLTQTKVGQRGENHFRQKLADSVDWTPALSVASAVSQAIQLPLGQIHAVVEATANCDLDNFEVACGNGGREAKKLLSKWIWDFIHASPTYICLIDEQQSEANDLSWQRDMLPSFADTVRFSGDSIFYYVSIKTISKEKISELVEATFWYPSYYAFVIDSDRVLDTHLPETEVSLDKLLEVTTHTSGLVTDAYDLEGLLIWTKQGSELNTLIPNQNGLNVAAE